MATRTSRRHGWLDGWTHRALTAGLLLRVLGCWPCPRAAGDEARALAVVVRLGGRFTRNEFAPGKPVVAVMLGGSKLTDADLKQVASLKHLRGMYLFHTRISDAGLKDLAGLGELHTLELSDTAVTDAGLKELARLKQLKNLFLGGTRVTDAGAKVLTEIEGLQWLDFSGTSITNAGLK